MREKTSRQINRPNNPLKGLAVAFFPLWLVCANADGLPREDDLFRWRLIQHETNEDGGRTLTFRLEGLKKGEQVLDVVYQSFPREGRSRINRTYGRPDFYRKKTEPGAVDFSIYSGRAEYIELWARIQRAGGFHYAQTVFAAFGQSGSRDADSQPMKVFPDWPAFRLSSGKNFYRAQTGVELAVQITPPPTRLVVFENLVPAAKPLANPQGLYRYTPPHETTLSKRGLSSKKEVFFAADLPDGQGKLSFYLPVFRAFYGQISLKNGLSVLFSAILLSLAFVWFLNRKFPWR